MDELAREASEKIKEWLVGKNKLVVAIDGYTGVGKTTLLENLVKINLDIAPMHMDDFLISSPRSFYLEQYDLVKVAEAIKNFRDNLGKKILVIEGVFMAHDNIKNLWDQIIYLDGDMAAIDKRRVEREKARWGEKYFPETHPDSQFRQVIIALKRYKDEYRPEKAADLVLVNN